MMGAVTAERAKSGRSQPPHNGEQNSRTLFTQGPRQGYLRHAQIVLFCESFDTSGGRRKSYRLRHLGERVEYM
jgi:hypothetical protein